MRPRTERFWQMKKNPNRSGFLAGMTHPSCRVVVRWRMSSRKALGGWAVPCEPGVGGGYRVCVSARFPELGSLRLLSRSFSPGQLMKTRRCASDGADCKDWGGIFNMLVAVFSIHHCSMDSSTKKPARQGRSTLSRGNTRSACNQKRCFG